MADQLNGYRIVWTGIGITCAVALWQHSKVGRYDFRNLNGAMVQRLDTATGAFAFCAPVENAPMACAPSVQELSAKMK